MRRAVTPPRPALRLGTMIFQVRTPYCDCTKPNTGFVKREDGVWVKPCCRRVTEFVWLQHGEKSVEDRKTCDGCISGEHNINPWSKETAS